MVKFKKTAVLGMLCESDRMLTYWKKYMPDCKCVFGVWVCQLSIALTNYQRVINLKGKLVLAYSLGRETPSSLLGTEEWQGVTCGEKAIRVRGLILPVRPTSDEQLCRHGVSEAVS